MVRFARAGAVILLSFGLVACAKAHARVEPELPALALPPVPPRDIAPALEAQDLPAELAAGEEAVPPPQRPARPPARAGAREAAPGRSEPARTPADGAAAGAGAEASPVAGPELRTPETADDEGAARRIREALDRAVRALAGVDARTLTADARTQFDSARRFIEQAEEALKGRNYVAALFLADKADTLARQLVGR